MPEILARDIMSRKVVTLGPEDSVTKAAKTLAEHRIGGAPVLDEEGRLIGMISESDLIIQDIKLHFPTYLQFLDSYIYLGSLARFERELRKAVGAKVKDVMTREVFTTTPDATVQEIATLMVDENISRIPVVKDSLVVGVVTKGDLVKSLGRD
jgi:CBS domain-containing protein